MADLERFEQLTDRDSRAATHGSRRDRLIYQSARRDSFGCQTGTAPVMDPEERAELLREVDEELDDTPKGRAIKDTINGMATSHRGEKDGGDDDE